MSIVGRWNVLRADRRDVPEYEGVVFEADWTQLHSWTALTATRLSLVGGRCPHVVLWRVALGFVCVGIALVARVRAAGTWRLRRARWWLLLPSSSEEVLAVEHPRGRTMKGEVRPFVFCSLGIRPAVCQMAKCSMLTGFNFAFSRARGFSQQVKQNAVAFGGSVCRCSLSISRLQLRL